jgi:hypothetical protein
MNMIEHISHHKQHYMNFKGFLLKIMQTCLYKYRNENSNVPHKSCPKVLKIEIANYRYKQTSTIDSPMYVLSVHP